MSLACILAAPDLQHEPELVALAPGFDLRIVRRCLDAADLLAAAALEPQLPIVLTPGLPRLSRDLVARLSDARLVVGLGIDESAIGQLGSLGVQCIVPVRSVERTLAELCTALTGRGEVAGRSPHQGVWSTGVWEAEAPSSPAPAPSLLARAAQQRGGLVAIWGPPGAPGRTPTALLMGRLMAAAGQRVCLIDADTTAPSIMQVCGVVEAASSLVVACRFAERDSLEPARLMATAQSIQGQLWALGGIDGPEHWGDVRAPALVATLEACRASFDCTLIDLGSGIERQQASDLLSLQRFQAATAALAAADALLAVVEASDLGISRFLRHHPMADAPLHESTAIALVPPHARGGVAAGFSSLRGYGITQPIFELPRCSTHEVVNGSVRGLARQRGRHRSVGVKDLQRWMVESIARRQRDYGEGSTTTVVPTRANL